MSDPYLSEIRIMAFGYAPEGWALANGQLLPIAQNQALFSLLGTTYGGDGRINFALPNLQSRVPAHMGNAFALGAVGGQETHVLLSAEMPLHTHGTAMGTSTSANTVATPAGNVLAGATNVYAPGLSNPVQLAGSSISMVGSNLPHENRQPYLTLNFCIALSGIYPSRN